MPSRIITTLLSSALRCGSDKTGEIGLSARASRTILDNGFGPALNLRERCFVILEDIHTKPLHEKLFQRRRSNQTALQHWSENCNFIDESFAESMSLINMHWERVITENAGSKSLIDVMIV